MKEAYFKRPILYDYLISIIIIGILMILENFEKIQVPPAKTSMDLASDIAAIGLTVSGFILTIIAILITLKSGQILTEEKLSNKSTAFKIFLASSLYARSIEILKNGVLSLIVISMILYFLKVGLSQGILDYIIYFNILALFLIIGTFLRCFYVLGLIIKMQRKSQ
ncbi:hypothetical protein [Draconibacterium sediminis]|uniref:hypothetical protein n=1 Tax=Draconibacterium sediminis TaxID=1544798 RepID=UPI0026EF3551|nr:hypothetical protein [Draconibacterium sediminis]